MNKQTTENVSACVVVVVHAGFANGYETDIVNMTATEWNDYVADYDD